MSEVEPVTIELIRLALPRRVYTQAHADFCIEVAAILAQEKQKIKGLKIVSQAPILRHFTARLSPID